MSIIVSVFLRWLTVAVGLFVAAAIVPGITRGESWQGLAITAAVLGVINLVLKPVLKLFSFPLMFVTLGAFVIVINTICLWLASWISEEYFTSDFRVDGVVAAFAGAIVVSLVAIVAGMVFRTP